MSAPPGRRERKKQLTRQAISDVATALFLRRGFEDVTIAEIAAAADVAVQTVFNHFPTKEDLLFDDQRWLTGPASVVPAEGPVTGALEAYYRTTVEVVRARGYLPTFTQFMRTIEASPALRARRGRLAEQMEERLADALSGGSPDWRSRLVAAQYATVQRVLDAELVRRLDERPGDVDAVLEGLSADITEAFAVLDRVARRAPRAPSRPTRA